MYQRTKCEDMRPFQSAPAECRRENAAAMLQSCIATFQSAPAECRRENVERRHRCLRCRFNPLPPNVGGRICCRWLCNPHLRCFNPLPPNVGGRMPASRRPAADDAVSIRSRRMSAGEFATADESRTLPGVSIRSRRMSAGEYAPRFREPTVSSEMFQSAPAECRRENADAWIDAKAASQVSIRSRRNVGGRILSEAGMIAANGDVSIRSRRMSAGECQSDFTLVRPDRHVSIRSRRMSAGEFVTAA